MIRYLRLYAAFVRFAVSRALEFRFDFFFRSIMDTVYYGVQIAFYKLLLLNSNILAGWNEAQVMIFVAGYLVVDALQMTVFANNVWQMPSLINKGAIDYHLVRPVSSLFFVSVRDFAVNSLLNLFIAGGILAWALLRYTGPIEPLRLLLYLGLLVNGAFLHYIVMMFWVLPAFWTQGRGFIGAFYGLTRLMERPDGIFKGWIRRILFSLLPFSLMASVPARLLMEAFDARLLVLTGAVTCALFGLLVFIWRSGLRSYASASS